MASPQGNTHNTSRMTCTDSANMTTMANQTPFYRRFTWQQHVPPPSGSSAVTLPMVRMALFPQTLGKKGEPDEDIQERKLKRMIKNRESAARFRARKLAYIKGLEEEVRRLEEEKRKLRQEMEFISVKLLLVQQEATRPQIRMTNSALF